MKTLLAIISIFTVVVIFSSCDKITGPYMERGRDTDTAVVKRKSIILDFTGHRCIGCPRSHRTIDQILSLYGSKVIPVAIHCGYYASPLAPDYSYDFRTNVGNYFGGDGETNFGIFEIYGTPAGMVNSLSKDSCTLTYSNWPTTVSRYATEAPLLKIEFTNSLSNNNQDVSTTIKTTALESLNKNLRLVVFVLEDSIIKRQKDSDAPGQEVENYVHKHVLRKALNGTWTQGTSLIGDELKSGDFDKDELVIKTYTFSLVGTDWVAGHVRLVAFIFDNDTKEILQAEECEPFN